MRTLYLDIATETGFCFGNPKEYWHGVRDFSPPKGEAPINRLLKFRAFLEGEKDLDRIVAESPFIMNRGNAGPVLYGLHTTLQLYCYDNHIELEYVAPKTLKKFITGNGNASKQKMMESLFKKYKIAVFNNDEADAIALMLYDTNKQHENQ